MRKIWLLSSCLCALVSATASGADTARHAEGSRLVSSAFPCMTVDLPASFRYLGSHDFEIKPVAGGTRHLFAEIQGHRIIRLVVLQFESILPGSTETYRYRIDGPEIGGIRWRESQFAFSDADEIRQAPDHEVALTAAYLRGHGYTFPDSWMVERLATVPDPTRLHESIIFYMEDLAATGQPLSAFFHGDDETSAWGPIASPLQKRGLAALHIRDSCTGG